MFRSTSQCKLVSANNMLRMPSRNKSDFRILVVDDDRLTRAVLVSLIRREGYENVDAAKSGQEGLAKLLVQRFHIVFLDIDMRGLNGIETLRAINESEFDVKVVMVSGISTPDAVLAAKEENAVGFIVKPPTQKKIGDAIDMCLERLS